MTLKSADGWADRALKIKQNFKLGLLRDVNTQKHKEAK